MDLLQRSGNVPSKNRRLNNLLRTSSMVSTVLINISGTYLGIPVIHMYLHLVETF